MSGAEAHGWAVALTWAAAILIRAAVVGIGVTLATVMAALFVATLL